MLRCLVPSLALACVLLSVNSNAALTPEWAQQEVQVDVALDFDNTKGKSHLYERSSEHSGLPSRKLLTSQDLPKKAPAPLPVPLAAPQSGSSPLSTSPSGSYASTLSQVTVVMVADVGSQASLRAAHCTWLSMLDPAQVVHMTDFELRLSSPQGSNSGSSGGKSRNRNGRSNGRGRDSSGGGSGSMLGGCGFPVTKVVKVKFAIDYYDIMHQLYVSEVRRRTICSDARTKMFEYAVFHLLVHSIRSLHTSRLVHTACLFCSRCTCALWNVSASSFTLF